MSRIFHLSVCQLNPSALTRQTDAWRERALAYVTFARDVPQDELAGVPGICVDTPVLDSTGDCLEVWCAAQKVSTGQRGDVCYSYNDNLVFGHIALLESSFSTALMDDDCASPLQRATKYAFQEIFGLLDTLNCPYLLRVWNYFPAINRDSYGLERYRQFNIGRQDGFVACERSLTEDIPAACALGTAGGRLVIYFIAGRAKPVAIENPRQVSAYHYPLDYGPRSPTFSRASLCQLGEQEVLFISGTASIIGHSSVHIGDVIAQTNESMVNIDAVVGEANHVSSNAHYDLTNLLYKVYVRRPEDAEAIHREMLRIVGPTVQAIYLEADICRQDLLVEIEATAGIPSVTL